MNCLFFINFIFIQSARGLKSDGLGGLAKGIGRGAVGLVLKPIVGVVDAASDVTAGIKNTTALGEGSRALPVRWPRSWYDL